MIAHLLKTRIPERLLYRVIPVLILFVSVPLFSETPDPGEAVFHIVSVDQSDFPGLHLTVEDIPHTPGYIKSEDEPYSAGQFELTEQTGVKERILSMESFSSTERRADVLRLVLIIDYTKSISKSDFELIQKDAIAVLGNMVGTDQSALLSFNRVPVLESDFSSDIKNMQKHVVDLKHKGLDTRIYDALYGGIYTAREAVKRLTEDEKHGRLYRHGVVLFTDGRDEGSYLKVDDVHEIARIGETYNIPIFTIFYGKSDNENVFQRLAMKTGGTVIHRDRSGQLPNMNEILRRLPGRIIKIHASSQTSLWDLLWNDSVRLQLGRNINGSYAETAAFYRLGRWLWLKRFYHIYKQELFIVGGILLILAGLLILYSMLRTGHDKRSHKEIIEPDEIHHSDTETTTHTTTTQTVVREQTTSGAIMQETISYPAGDVSKLREYPEDMGTMQEDTGIHPPAGIERKRQYMKQYSYHMLQLAIRDCERYTEAYLKLDEQGRNITDRYDLFLEETAIGSGKWADIRIQDPSLSAVHGKIKKVDERFVLYDLMSDGGTYLNEKKLLRPRGLSDGDRIRLGRVEFHFHGKVK